MGKVRVEFLSRLANTLGMAGNSREAVLEVQSGKNRTVRDLLSELAVKYPRFGQNVFDIKMGKLNERVNVFLNGRLLVPENGLETRLNDGDTLVFLPLIEGG